MESMESRIFQADSTATRIEVSLEPITRADKGSMRVLDKAKRTARKPYQDLQFVAWDGEGGTVGDDHRYLLFGNSLGTTIEDVILSWRDTFPVIMAAPKEAIHIIYSGVYDFVKMTDQLPTEIADRLLKGEPTYLGVYRVRYLRGKMLMISDPSQRDPSTGRAVTRTLFDVFSFFQCSFVKACREYLGDRPEFDAIEAMKDQRSGFGQVTPEVRVYMNQELDYLVLLAEQLRARLAAVGIEPSSWHGPGAVASTVLRKHGIGKARGVYEPRLRTAMESAYYGGRFEAFKRGRNNAPVWEYDIRSAYPSAMVHLPDLSEVSYYHCVKPKEISEYGLYYVRCRNLGEGSRNRHPLPWRKADGSIYYPSWVHGWYWGVEIPGWLVPSISHGYHPEGDGLGARPFSFVAEMYDRRRELKKQRKPEQLALKLALNSLYGKLAQSTGAKKLDDGSWRLPSFHEPMWAGWITAYTRRKMADLITAYPDNVIAVETDALILDREIDSLKLGPNLGEWEKITADDIIYLQSGVYLVQQEGEWRVKSRGFSPKGHTVEKWLAYLQDTPSREEAGISVRHHRFATVPRQATFGQWYATDHTLRLDGTPSKRVHPYVDSDGLSVGCQACSSGLSYADGMHRLWVPELVQRMSTPYPFPWSEQSRAGMTLEEQAMEYDPLQEMELL